MQKTSLICNNFSGINRTSSVYLRGLITASDINNVSMAFKRRYLSYDNSFQLVSFPVKKGDIITCTFSI